MELTAGRTDKQERLIRRLHNKKKFISLLKYISVQNQKKTIYAYVQNVNSEYSQQASSNCF